MEDESRKGYTAWVDKGTDMTRVLALSDGVFAIALTLLAIDLIIPELDPANIHGELQAALLALIPKFLVYALAFYLVVIKWMAHRRIFEHVVRYDSNLLWLNNLFLLFIAFMPVPAAVLGRYPTETLALIFFGVTQIVTTCSQWGLWTYATYKHRLIDNELTTEMIRFFHRRYIGQLLGLLAFTLGALVSPWFALGGLVLFMVLFQGLVGFQRRRNDAMHSGSQ